MKTTVLTPEQLRLAAQSARQWVVDEDNPCVMYWHTEANDW